MSKTAREPGPIGQEVVAIIRERMGRQRIKQADLVRLTNMQQSTLSRILDEQREIGIDEAQVIGVALKTTGADLINEAVTRLSADK